MAVGVFVFRRGTSACYFRCVERAALLAKLDRLLGLRGNPVHGLEPSAWAESLEGVEPSVLLRSVIAVVRELLIPDWADRRRADRRPQLALEAAEAWLAEPTGEEPLTLAKAASKACTAARNETFGDDHRVPEAARFVARVPTAKDAMPMFEALACVEEELLARIALMAEYHRGPEQRRAIVDVLRRELLPPEPEAVPAAATHEGASPVPYSADGHFALAQRLVHKKFGDIVVTGVGETWIEVALPDGSQKRLAHRP